MDKSLHSQDLRNERPEVEFCNIMYEMLPTILMIPFEQIIKKITE